MIIGVYDLDQYLINYIQPKEIPKILSISKRLNECLTATKILKTLEKYKTMDINIICKNGDICLLEWFKNSGYEFKYNEQAINWASTNGHVDVLEWFKNSGYEFKYDERAIINASSNPIHYYS